MNLTHFYQKKVMIYYCNIVIFLKQITKRFIFEVFVFLTVLEVRESWTPQVFLEKGWHPPPPFVFPFLFCVSFSFFFLFSLLFVLFPLKNHKKVTQTTISSLKLNYLIRKKKAPFSNLLCFSFSLLYYIFSFSHFFTFFFKKNHQNDDYHSKNYLYTFRKKVP